ncbi:hypothetical protein EDEG_04075 [Edhazardia aedis USNM 41457]|uniref:Oxidation resistance protein 1 n=1 Tax=Edhazardia aedis (strain USNM 41457) TaxID=1003232 RepID=J9DRY2_EDHAE|nr:hypothetical protein EDEG_04075 [Edhazardia aedis USNM 41457]|eukprot:EJW05335.1 hypothetical protein EDEG_04075 [Edhazardia aedis USNM 41457]
MEFFKKLFGKKRSAEENKGEEKVISPSRLITGFKFIFKENEYTPQIKIDYEKLKEQLLEPKYAIAPNWSLVYSTVEHGFSKKTFHMCLDTMKKNYKPPLLFVIQDTSLNIFGVFFDENIEISNHCFGKVNTFLWRMVSIDEMTKTERSFPYMQYTQKNNNYMDKKELQENFSIEKDEINHLKKNTDKMLRDLDKYNDIGNNLINQKYGFRHLFNNFDDDAYYDLNASKNILKDKQAINEIKRNIISRESGHFTNEIIEIEDVNSLSLQDQEEDRLFLRKKKSKEENFESAKIFGSDKDEGMCDNLSIKNRVVKSQKINFKVCGIDSRIFYVCKHEPIEPEIKKQGKRVGFFKKKCEKLDDVTLKYDLMPEIYKNFHFKNSIVTPEILELRDLQFIIKNFIQKKIDDKIYRSPQFFYLLKAYPDSIISIKDYISKIAEIIQENNDKANKRSDYCYNKADLNTSNENNVENINTTCAKNTFNYENYDAEYFKEYDQNSFDDDFLFDLASNASNYDQYQNIANEITSAYHINSFKSDQQNINNKQKNKIILDSEININSCKQNISISGDLEIKNIHSGYLSNDEISRNIHWNNCIVSQQKTNELINECIKKTEIELIKLFRRFSFTDINVNAEVTEKYNIGQLERQSYMHRSKKFASFLKKIQNSPERFVNHVNNLNNKYNKQILFKNYMLNKNLCSKKEYDEVIKKINQQVDSDVYKIFLDGKLNIEGLRTMKIKSKENDEFMEDDRKIGIIGLTKNGSVIEAWNNDYQESYDGFDEQKILKDGKNYKYNLYLNMDSDDYNPIFDEIYEILNSKKYILERNKRKADVIDIHNSNIYTNADISKNISAKVARESQKNIDIDKNIKEPKISSNNLYLHQKPQISKFNYSKNENNRNKEQVKELAADNVILNSNISGNLINTNKKVYFPPNKNNSYDKSTSGNYFFRKYPATRENACYCYCTVDYIAFGCSDGKFGLMLFDSFSRGESNTVKTFKNEQLSKDSIFTVKRLEVWSIDT